MQTNHHYEDSHRRRAEHDHYTQAIADSIEDLIHTGVLLEEGEDFSSINREELLETIALQNYYLHPLLTDTGNLLASVQDHFNMITSIMAE